MTMVIGLPVRLALPEVEGQGFFELLDQVYQTGEAHSGQSDYRVGCRTRRAGTRFCLSAVGRITGIFVEGEDVIEVVTQTQVLRESEEKFLSFAQLAPHPMWTAPANGQLD